MDRRVLAPVPTLATLAYLDGRSLVNRTRLLLREPRRLLVWAAFIAWIVLDRFLFIRHAEPFSLPSGLGPTILGLVPGAYIVFFGLSLRTAAIRAPAAFASPADARFLCGSALDSRWVVLWLELRRVVRPARLWLMNVPIWWAFLAPVLHAGVLSLIRFALALTLAVALVEALRLPAFLLKRRFRTLPVGQVGGGLTLFGIATMAATGLHTFGLGGPWLMPLARLAPTLPLGAWVAGAFLGRIADFLVLAVLTGAAVSTCIAFAGDSYPELWEASSRLFAIRRVVRHGRSLPAAERREALRQAGVMSSPVRRVRSFHPGARTFPGGPWTLLWKEWITLGRSPTGWRGPVQILVAAALCGVGVEFLLRHVPPGARIGLLSGIVGYPVLIYAAAIGVSLRSDLEKPLWWLSQSSLRARLGVWALALSLRVTVPCAVGLIVATALSNHVLLGLSALPLLAAGLWELRSAGLATYAMFPAPGDMRGPGALLRLVTILVLAIPTAALIALTRAVSGAWAPALLVGAVPATLEGWLLIAFAASRLRGDALRVVRLEAR